MEASYLLIAIGVGVAFGAILATVYSYLMKAKLGDIEKGVDYYREGVTYFPENEELKLRIKGYGEKDKNLKN